MGSKNKKNNGVVRIIGGNMRGRKINFEDSDGLRPTLDRIRETLFNWLAADIYGKNCLDLFSGSGALSFEAVSRGANSVCMIEKNKKSALNLQKNCETLKINNASIINASAESFLNENKQKFDLVFLDPPFGLSLLEPTFKLLTPHLNEDSIIYLEQEKSNHEFKLPDPWQQQKYKSTGKFSYALYKKPELNL